MRATTGLATVHPASRTSSNHRASKTDCLSTTRVVNGRVCRSLSGVTESLSRKKRTRGPSPLDVRGKLKGCQRRFSTCRKRQSMAIKSRKGGPAREQGAGGSAGAEGGCTRPRGPRGAGGKQGRPQPTVPAPGGRRVYTQVLESRGLAGPPAALHAGTWGTVLEHPGPGEQRASRAPRSPPCRHLGDGACTPRSP